jgi:hypothetical protein
MRRLHFGLLVADLDRSLAVPGSTYMDSEVGLRTLAPRAKYETCGSADSSLFRRLGSSRGRRHLRTAR